MRIGPLFIGWRSADHTEAAELGLPRAPRGWSWRVFVLQWGDAGVTLIADLKEKQS